jgi:hypothetical protein
MILRVNMKGRETDPAAAPYSLDDLIADIRPGFAFSRYGDGEWKLVLDSPWRDGLNEAFTPDLCEAMRQTLLDYNGVKLGMQSVEYLRKRELFDSAQTWLADNGLNHLRWHEADVLHRASAAGKLQAFANAVRPLSPVMIGPEYLGALPFIDRHIPIPRALVWSHREEVFRQADVLHDCVVLVSAGPLAKVLAHRLHALDRGLAVIDTGSVLDPYCGRKSRGYMRAKRQKFRPLR